MGVPVRPHRNKDWRAVTAWNCFVEALRITCATRVLATAANASQGLVEVDVTYPHRVQYDTSERDEGDFDSSRSLLQQCHTS